MCIECSLSRDKNVQKHQFYPKMHSSPKMYKFIFCAVEIETHGVLIETCSVVIVVRNAQKFGDGGGRRCHSEAVEYFPVRAAGHRGQRLPQQALRGAGPEVVQPQHHLGVSKNPSNFWSRREPAFPSRPKIFVES
jgi:hypothetical protein